MCSFDSVHLFELFLDAVESHRHVLDLDTHDLGNFLIAHVLEPQQDDGAVERLQPLDAGMQHVGLAVVGVVFVKQVDVLHERLSHAALFLAVHGDTGVQGHLVNPRLQVALALKGSKTLPQLDERLLEEVIDLVLVLGEHVANGVDGALVLADDARKIGFVDFH